MKFHQFNIKSVRSVFVDILNRIIMRHFRSRNDEKEFFLFANLRYNKNDFPRWRI